MSKTYNHKEAFCLMTYKCEKCQDVEVLWNSRDGVTPFIIGCKKCDGSMKHVMWNLDKCEPNYKPEKGSRVFKTHTHETYKKELQKYVTHLWDKNISDARNRYIFKLELFRALYDFQKGQPYIHTIE